jgi:hypothetical protein
MNVGDTVEHMYNHFTYEVTGKYSFAKVLARPLNRDMDQTPRPLQIENLRLVKRGNGELLSSDKANKKFQVGDIVRLRFGSRPIKIIAISGKLITADYVNSSYRLWGRHTSDFEYYETQQTQKEETMNNLYEVTEATGTIFATKLATNSEGLWVMEERGTGRVFTSDKSKVEEVMPYTIGIKFLKSESFVDSKEYSYFAQKGKFAVGDTFLFNDSIAWVSAVDTKSKSATKEFTPTIKIKTEVFG